MSFHGKENIESLRQRVASLLRTIETAISAGIPVETFEAEPVLTMLASDKANAKVASTESTVQGIDAIIKTRTGTDAKAYTAALESLGIMAIGRRTKRDGTAKEYTMLLTGFRPAGKADLERLTAAAKAFAKGTDTTIASPEAAIAKAARLIG